MNSQIRPARPRRAAAAPALALASALTLALAALPGCGETGPEMAPVSGTVTYNGEPLTKGTVSFVSPDGTHNASGTIGSDGRYTLQSREPGDGAQVGEYAVIVTDVANSEILDYIPKKPVAKKATLPEKFGDPKSSGINVTVKSGSNTIPIDLKD